MNAEGAIDGLDQAAGLTTRPLHLAVGIFDGVHLGHRSVIDAAIAGAKADGGTVGALTFWPHPSRLFRPEDPVRMIQSAALKHRHLRMAGAEVVISQAFTTEFAQIEAEAFVPMLLRCLPTLRAIYVGANWRFGRGRRGDVTLLAAEGARHGLRVVSAPRIEEAGEWVSSTRIRQALQDGRVESANRMLGYAYYAEGRVTPGKRLGRTIGFPTLNVPWEPDLRPAYGVYAVRVRGAKMTTGLPAVANYGLRPTVEQTDQPRLEVHVLGECPFAETDAVSVEWLSFLRPEARFSGLEPLREQISKDIKKAAEFFLR